MPAKLVRKSPTLFEFKYFSRFNNPDPVLPGIVPPSTSTGFMNDLKPLPRQASSAVPMARPPWEATASDWSGPHIRDESGRVKGKSSGTWRKISNNNMFWSIGYVSNSHSYLYVDVNIYIYTSIRIVPFKITPDSRPFQMKSILKQLSTNIARNLVDQGELHRNNDNFSRTVTVSLKQLPYVVFSNETLQRNLNRLYSCFISV